MKSSRLSAENHWRGVGRRAKTSGIPLCKVLTQSSKVNAWIQEGYNSVKK